jgi:hypothetical protein
MPTRRIREPEVPAVGDGFPCVSPDHNPPSHQVFAPGLYEHECSRCHRKQRFRVERVRL